MKNLIAYFEGAAKDLQKLIDDPMLSTEQNIKNMAITLQANAALMNTKHD